MIRTLPKDVVNLISASEVIDSWAAVVRELCENAVDAQATRITINLEPEQWRLQIADNGQGMGKKDLEQASTAHSTSKINDRHDLWKINSLGFRGEALHSIAQLANLTILSRQVGSDEGYQITYNQDGQPLTYSYCAIAPGTIVNVTNLFANWLPRKESLPHLSQQLRQVQQQIINLSLCHPHISWQVLQNDRPWFHISANHSLLQIIPQLLPRVHPEDFRYLLQQVTESDKIHLLLGIPSLCHRQRPDWIKIAVNGRVVKCPELEQVVINSLIRTVPRDRYPVCFVHLQIAPRQIDWHRIATKTEIYLQNLDYWQEQIKQMISSALSLTPTATPSNQLQQLITVGENKGKYHLSKNSQDTNQLDLLPLKALAQLHQTYIIAEHPDGMWLVEQHIAHERILYDQITQDWQLLPLSSPLLLSNLSAEQIEQLQTIGISVEPFGVDTWVIRQAPKLLINPPDHFCRDTTNTLTEALLEISLGVDLTAAQVSVACRCAIRNGTPLTVEEMQTLLNQWQITRNPHTCPHGRPIYLSLNEPSLARFFRRHWVIGKSHGI